MTTRIIEYELDRLFVDQKPGLVKHTIAAFISWCYAEYRIKKSISFTVVNTAFQPTTVVKVLIDMGKIKKVYSDIQVDLEGFLRKESILQEDQAKLAAYCFALIQSTVLLTKRIERASFYSAPDLLYRIKPHRCGIEVAGRTNGSTSSIKAVVFGPKKKRGKNKSTGPRRQQKGKWNQLKNDTGISECFLSVSGASTLRSLWEKVKP